MTQQAGSATVATAWPQWEGELVNGAFPLRRLLNGSDHSQVFLTEYKSQHLADAAIKIVPAELVPAEAQLAHWRIAAALSHPHLLRLFEAGRFERDQREFLFVVMEYAEETLSEILPHRALTSEEVGAMLPPILEALAFLHRRGLVHAQLQPTNLLVVGDQLKLSSDNIRAAGESAASSARSSLYDPPEAGNGRLSPAGDLWALGMTLVEAVTQHPPWPPRERSETIALPQDLPPMLVQIIRRCLSHDPAARPTVFELQAQLLGTLPVPGESAEPVEPAHTAAAARGMEHAAAAGHPQPRRSWVPMIAALVVVLTIVWAALQLLRGRHGAPHSAPVASEPSPERASPPPSPERLAQPQAGTGAAVAVAPASMPHEPAAVLHEEMPVIAKSATDTIHGHFDVTVHVTVNSAGNVVDERLEDAGPSKYFARRATEAAQKWKFAPGEPHSSREWLLRFEFSRDGTAAHAEAAAPPPLP